MSAKEGRTFLVYQGRTSGRYRGRGEHAVERCVVLLSSNPCRDEHAGDRSPRREDPARQHHQEPSEDGRAHRHPQGLDDLHERSYERHASLLSVVAVNPR